MNGYDAAPAGEPAPISIHLNPDRHPGELDGADGDLGATDVVDLSGATWEEHWEEVDLALEMWRKVAHAWGNDTLVRLVRDARTQAEAEKLLLARENRRSGRTGNVLSNETFGRESFVQFVAGVGSTGIGSR